MKKIKFLLLATVLCAGSVVFAQTQIAVVGDLALIQSGSENAPNKYVVTADIDLIDITSGLGDKEWIEIDGGGHVLSNVLLTGGDRGGIFNNLDNSTIKNLQLVDCAASGGWCGIIAGHTGNVRFEKISLKNPTVQSTGIGGALVGHASGGVIMECEVINGSVNGHDHVGGIAGHIEGTIIRDCYVDAVVQATGGWQIGGIAGWAQNEGTVITRCFTKGTAGGDGFTGGILGIADGSDHAHVTLTDNIAFQTQLTANSDIVKTNRIIAAENAANYSNNFGNVDMTWDDPHRTEAWINEPDGKDGSDITAEQIANAQLYAQYLPNWDITNVWSVTAAGPVLKWTSQSSNVKSPVADNVRVSAVNGMVQVAAPAGELISIYNTLGQRLATRIAGSSVESFAVEGIVIVKAGGYVCKIKN